jgi:hypothetical protein
MHLKSKRDYLEQIVPIALQESVHEGGGLKEMIKNPKLASLLILILILGFVIGIFVTNLCYHMNWENKPPITKVMEENDTYYQVLDQQSASHKETYWEVPTEAVQYKEKVVAYTYYDKNENQCHMILDFFFSDATQFYDKSELFLKFDERLQWTTDNAIAKLWVFENDGYICKETLPFSNAGFLSAGIDIQALNEKNFPLHIQVDLTAAWAEEEKPEKIVFEYGLW